MLSNVGSPVMTNVSLRWGCGFDEGYICWGREYMGNAFTFLLLLLQT